ncbi:glycosyltransferase family 2 protein [bacterium]|nr:glycosyltransferase family 2 protein [bacterium]
MVNQNKISEEKGLIIITCYNQCIEIEKVINSCIALRRPETILIVDDGSTDGSVEIIRKSGLQFISHTHNQGVGAAIRTGLEYALKHDYSYIALVSGNGKSPPEFIKDLVDPILTNQADYTTGSRFIPGGSSPGLPLFRKITIPIFSNIASIILRRKFTDITCGYRAYRLSFLMHASVHISQSWLDRYELEYYLHYYACKLKLRIKEVPVTIKYDHLHKSRVSHIRVMHDGWSIIRTFLLLPLGLKK